jgi:hypothetical protein
MPVRNPAATTLSFVDAVCARTDEKNAGQHETDFDRGESRAKTTAVLDADRMSNRDEQQNENARPKEQTQDDKDAADRAEQGANESPQLEMRVNTKTPDPGSKMSPGIGPAQQCRRRVKEEEDADADPQQEQPEISVFREESHSHGAMIKRSGARRKSNSRTSVRLKERRFEIAEREDGGFKPPLLEAF